jgi:2-polyprenyl-3-methyl-5-hydroxy-6-metoxy-1,4-benzoquinol methylase
VELGIADRVDFVGHQDDVYPWLDAIDVVVHASLGEPFGLVVVEAMALGKPVVATAAGGPVEIIEDGVSGILTRPGDVAALAGAVEGLLGAPTTALALGARARERAREFSDQRTAEQFVSLIRQVRQTSGVASRGDQVGLIERTVEGLHDYLEHCVLPRSRRPGQRAIDLGAGSGALAIRLERLGYDVLAVDTDRPSFEAQVVFCAVDLNESGFADALGREGFALVTAVEVIEHLQSPIAFLQGVRALLADDGIAVVTTPNLDSLPARVKFLVKGKVRMFDERGDPTHITPILWDLLVRQYLPCSGLRIVEQHLYPPDGFLSGRPAYRRALNLVGPWLTRCGPRLVGDNHVLVLSRADSTR